jgi:hypothetical protein
MSYCASLVPGLLGFADMTAEQAELADLVVNPNPKYQNPKPKNPNPEPEKPEP